MGKVLFVAWFDNGLKSPDRQEIFLGVFSTARKASDVAVEYTEKKREEYLYKNCQAVVESVILDYVPDSLR